MSNAVLFGVKSIVQWKFERFIFLYLHCLYAFSVFFFKCLPYLGHLNTKEFLEFCFCLPGCLSKLKYFLCYENNSSLKQVVGGKMTESGRLCAFITKVKKGSLADTVGHLRPGTYLL